MPKIPAVKCAANPWLMNHIINEKFNHLYKGRFFILNEATALEYWNIPENFIETQGLESNKHYVVIGSDGERCIKSLFTKIAVENAIFTGISESQSSTATVDWRNSSLFLTRFYLKTMLPCNAMNPEFVLIVESFDILGQSDVDAYENIIGFMNYIMETKDCQFRAAEQHKKCIGLDQNDDDAVEDSVVCLDDEDNMSLLIAELVKKNSGSQQLTVLPFNKLAFEDNDVRKINISRESADCPPNKKGKATAQEPLPTNDLWQNAPNDVPGWLPIVTSSPIVDFNSPSTSCSSTTACVNGDLVVSTNPVKVIVGNSSLTEPFVYVRSAKIQTSNRITGWRMNDQRTNVSIEAFPNNSQPNVARGHSQNSPKPSISVIESVQNPGCSKLNGSSPAVAIEGALPPDCDGQSNSAQISLKQAENSCSTKIVHDSEMNSSPNKPLDSEDVEFLGREVRPTTSKKCTNNSLSRSNHFECKSNPGEHSSKRNKEMNDTTKKSSLLTRQSPRFNTVRDHNESEGEFYQNFTLPDDLKEKCLNFIFD